MINEAVGLCRGQRNYGRSELPRPDRKMSLLWQRRACSIFSNTTWGTTNAATVQLLHTTVPLAVWAGCRLRSPRTTGNEK